jgi:uncharacterized SAM-binding protein YcdF (DUF218 family)
MTRPTRLIVVLGYSNGQDGNALHPICRARLETAASLATADDVVVLSGWARRAEARPEAELMAAAWTGVSRELVVDPNARTTVENLANALNDVLRVGAHEVVIVTSAWHAARAKAAMRWLLMHTGVKVSAATPDDGSLVATLAELRLWPLLPFQLWHAGRKSWTI